MIILSVSSKKVNDLQSKNSKIFVSRIRSGEFLWGNGKLQSKKFPTLKKIPQKYTTPLDKLALGVVLYFCHFRVSRKILVVCVIAKAVTEGGMKWVVYC